MSKTYNKLLNERLTILSEMKTKIECSCWDIYTNLEIYLSNVEMKINEYEINERKKVYAKIHEKLPIELVEHIASYGQNITDRCAILAYTKEN